MQVASYEVDVDVGSSSTDAGSDGIIALKEGDSEMQGICRVITIFSCYGKCCSIALAVASVSVRSVMVYSVNQNVCSLCFYYECVRIFYDFWDEIRNGGTEIWGFAFSFSGTRLRHLKIVILHLIHI